MKSLLLATALLAANATAAESLDQLYAAQGRLILTQFVSAPFPHPSRAAGWTYQNQSYSAAEHYADSTVALFVPRGFRETGRVDFVVHFHGWRNTVAGTLQQYQLIPQLVDSGRNAVLVVPEGPRDAPDSGGGKLEDPGGFARFMDEVVATLKQRGGLRKDFVPGDIILSGHSGGYRVMAAILERGGLTTHIKEVWLFDALYAQGESFLTWAEQPGVRLLDIYTDTGGTKARTEDLIARLKQRNSPGLLATEDTALGAELQTNRFIFLHTDLAHNDVVAKRRTFQKFLETSRLSLRWEKPGETSRQLSPELPDRSGLPTRP